MMCNILMCAIALGCNPVVAHDPVWTVTDDAPFVAWKTKIGSDAGTPILAGEQILIGTNNAFPRDGRTKDDCGVLMSFSRKEGDFLWQLTHARLPHRANDLPTLGILGRPATDGRRVYYQTNRGDLVCYEDTGGKSQTPKLVWKVGLVSDLGVFKRDAGDIGNPIPSPLIVGDLVYSVTGNGSDFGYVGEFGKRPFVPKPDAPSFVAVEKQTGKVAWKSAAPGRAIAYAQWGSPVAAVVKGKMRVFFPGGDGYLYAFEAISGKLLGKVDCNLKVKKEWGPGRGDRTFFLSQPVVHESVAYIGLNQDMETPEDVSCPIVAIDLGRLCDGSDGAVKWSYSDPSFNGAVGCVAISGNSVFTISRSGLLVAVDSRTGLKVWSHKLDGCSRFGGPVIYRGRVYAPASDAIHVFKIDPEPMALGKYEFERLLMGSPVIEDNHLFIASSRYLWCIRRQDSD